MKKLLVILVFVSISGFSQSTGRSDFWDHVRFGGGFGFGFGNNTTTLAIAPSAIYVFDEQFAVGPSVSYLYSKNYDVRSNVYGLGAIGLYNPTDFLQVSAEFEHSFVTQKYQNESYRFNFPALYVGLAYRTGWFAAGLRYDVLYDSGDTIYASAWSPIVRFYF